MSESSEVSYGQFLKQGREDKGITLPQLSQKTKINIKILESLENDHFEGLPPRSYLVGFTRSYAREVGLSAEKCLDLLNLAIQKSGLNRPYFPVDNSNLNSLTPTIEQEKIKDLETLQDVKPGQGQFPFKSLGLSLGAIVVIFFFIYTIKGQIDVAKDDLAVKEQTEEITQQSTPQDNVISEVQPSTESQSSESANLSASKNFIEAHPPLNTGIQSTADQTAQIAVPGSVNDPEIQFEEESIPSVQPNFVEISKAMATATVSLNLKFQKAFFYRRLYPPLYQLRPLGEQITTEIYPESARNANKSFKNRLFLRATEGDSWVTYKADDFDIRAMTLKKGDTLEVPAQKVILIFLGIASNVTMIFNDQVVDFNAPKGFKSLVFPESEISNYSLPLFVTEDDGKIYTAMEYEKLVKQELEKQTSRN